MEKENVVDGIDEFFKRIDMGEVDIEGGWGIEEEKGKRKKMIEMMGWRRIGVDDIIRKNIIGIMIILKIIVGNEGRRVIEKEDIEIIEDLDIRKDGVDWGGRMIDVGDR